MTDRELLTAPDGTPVTTVTVAIASPDGSFERHSAGVNLGGEATPAEVEAAFADCVARAMYVFRRVGERRQHQGAES